jgi:hypothetical protein
MAPRAAGDEALEVRAGDTLDLARACWIEARDSLADCAAIAYVIARRSARAGVPFSAHLRAYSALGNATARARLAATFDATTGPPSWHRVRAYAERIAAGEVADPCPRAMHYAGPVIDAARIERAVREGRLRRVRCREKVSNTFLVETGKRGVVLSAMEASGNE